jgi:hypothetical protein
VKDNKAQAGVPLHIRRVVTGHDEGGVSVIVSDGAPPVSSAYQHIPGMMTRLIWATQVGSGIPLHPVEPTSPILSHVPDVGETRFIVATFPPDSVFASPNFDGMLAGEENARLSPGLAELFDERGFHQSDSIDYAIVLEGSITLELGDGSRTVLRRHDVTVQNGTRHAWRNETDRPATLAFILMGKANRSEI